MNDLTYLYKLFLCCTLLAVLAACTEELEQDRVNKGQGHTARLELSLSVPPLVETKAVICAADSGSAARKAGFSYEMQVLTTDTTGVGFAGVSTKAASSLKNVYAFLFKSDGTFNGRASLATADIHSEISLVFTNIADASAANGRLVIIANDGLAATNYASSTAFASFSGTYTAFQNLTLTSAVTSDVDIPYVGSATVSLSGGSFSTLPTVQLYRMLAKIVLTNSTFSIEGGPSRNAIDLINAGNRYFGTPNNNGDGYNGVGSTATASARIIVKSSGTNADTNTWYVGENVQTGAVNAAYIELGTGVGGGRGNLTPAIGEEYIIGGGYSFTYKVYLNGYALRRNNVYNITVRVSGTLDKQLELASAPNSNVSVTHSTAERGGLNIGLFGGASGYTPGTGNAPTITGVYTKHLLIQPNTSGLTAVDNVKKVYSHTTYLMQRETRRYWDHGYTSANMDYTAGFAYDYCYNLTIGGVAKGTWYLPTQAQLAAIWTILEGIKENSSYVAYFAFAAYDYWSATGSTSNAAFLVNFSIGNVQDYATMTFSTYVRCVRDLL